MSICRNILLMLLCLLTWCNPVVAQNNESHDSVAEDEEQYFQQDKFATDTVLWVNHPVDNNYLADSLKHMKAFSYAANLDSILKAWQDEETRRQQSFKNSRPSTLARILSSNITMYFFWIVAVLLVGFILYKLFITGGGFRRQYKRSAVTELPGEEEKLSATTDYLQLVRNAETEKDYRLAVRYLYLQALQKLSASGLIKYAADKTNHQYVRELYGKPMKDEFASLTLHYEYVWYGAFEIGEIIYPQLKKRFIQFAETMPDE